MDERDFVGKKREAWDRLSALIDKANGTGGVRRLTRDELLSLGPLYRRASSDLAYARAHAISSDLVLHLNGLVGRAHALLYEAETSRSPLRSVVDFYLIDFPALLQRHIRYFLFAFGVLVAGGVFAYWLVLNYPTKSDLFIPPGFQSSLDAWKSGKVADDANVQFAGALMTHNQQVGMLTFASGVACGIPTFFMVFETGGMMGAFAAIMKQVHRQSTFWPGIVPHGVAEVTALLICSAAGFLIGMSLLMPGPYLRRDAFRLAGLDAIKLVLGTLPMFFFAGIIEGMFSHLAIPASIRYAFAITNGILWYLYLFLPRRPRSVPTEPALARNLPSR